MQAVGHALHAVMALVMAIMPWPIWTTVPVSPQLILFAAASAWFVLLGVLQARRTVTRRMLGGHGSWHQIAHAVMMLAMVWMVVVMIPSPPGATPEVGGAHAHAMLSGPVVLSGVAITAALVVVAVIQTAELIECVRGRARTWFGHTGDVATGAVMGFGMAAMCWTMLAA
ncbi:DUF5134 domain-containing protein [Microbacterium sp. NIBRBAC000506063]|uniref:DUF5134 domain-containing protein n=1 Tax=Microbacterium sp. NIBRBAC000506063 TaxID=2734618 RepID=UPI001BB803EE|nr:DUF5134 domain-containing protein [Microbacterium sp. NIBRBAC000506063]QTV80358.1 DUF5134 domain-containing protein [Microbacterium sp. NIBRBAC000506063]